jgi:uncharacterized protein YjbJ (UPF0337 family)
MNRDEVEGKAKEVKGKVKQGVGDLTDDERLRDEGEADQAEGEVQGAYGKARRKVGEAIEDVGETHQAVVHFLFAPVNCEDFGIRRRGLDPPAAFCYIRKVLVGPRTPYLGPDSKTRHVARAFAERIAIVRPCCIADASASERSIINLLGKSAPGAGPFCGSLGLEHRT